MPSLFYLCTSCDVETSRFSVYLVLEICNTECSIYNIVINVSFYIYVHPYYSSLHSLQDGCTALYMASQNGHASVVDVLLRHGADPHETETVSIEVVY